MARKRMVDSLVQARWSARIAPNRDLAESESGLVPSSLAEMRIQAMYAAEWRKAHDDQATLEYAYRSGMKSLLDLHRKNQMPPGQFEEILSAFMAIYLEAKINSLVNNKLNDLVFKLRSSYE